MLIDLRIYTYLPSKFRRFLKGYEEIGFGLTTKHLGRTLGIFRSDGLTMNRTFQFFVYRDAAHRDACRQGMLIDPAWGEFVKIDGDAILNQQNELLTPTRFSPLRDFEGEWPASAPQGRTFELRRWIVLPADMDDALAELEKCAGLLPDAIGYFTVTAGAENQIIMLRAFANAADRENKQISIWKDANLLKSFRKKITNEISEIILPFKYSPLT